MKKVHHSLDDWDFDPDGKYSIDASQYVSPPTSLACPHEAGGSHYSWLFLKPALGSNIPDGRLITYERFLLDAGKEIRIYFRCQALPTNDIPSNTYELRFAANQCILYQRLASVYLQLAIEDLSYARNINTWYHQRLSFYSWLNASLETVLTITLDTEIAGSWVQQLTHDIIDPLWQDSANNRIGIALTGLHPAFTQWLDDTEVWRKI